MVKMLENHTNTNNVHLTYPVLLRTLPCKMTIITSQHQIGPNGPRLRKQIRLLEGNCLCIANRKVVTQRWVSIGLAVFGNVHHRPWRTVTVNIGATASHFRQVIFMRLIYPSYSRILLNERQLIILTSTGGNIFILYVPKNSGYYIEIDSFIVI